MIAPCNMSSFILPMRWENQRNLVFACVIKLIHKKKKLGIISQVVWLQFLSRKKQQQQQKHISAKQNSHINLGIKLASKFACKAENKNKEHLITLMEKQW